jgi:hypothetical protein
LIFAPRISYQVFVKTGEAWVIGWAPHPPSKAAIIGFVAAVLWACGLSFAGEVIGDRLMQDALTDAEHRAEGMSRAAEQFALRTLGDARVPHALAQRWAELAPDAPQAARAELEIMMNRDRVPTRGVGFAILGGFSRRVIPPRRAG